MYLLALLAVPTPSPSPSPPFNPDLITPGVFGFLAILFVAVATVFLVLDMNRRIRRTRYRGELRERLELEAAEQAKKSARDKRNGRAR